MNTFVIVGIIELAVAAVVTILGSLYLYKHNAALKSFVGYILTVLSIIAALGLITIHSELMTGGIISLLLSCLSSIPVLKIYHFPVRNVFLSAFAVSLISFWSNYILLDKTDALWAIAAIVLAIWGIPFSLCLGIFVNIWLLWIKKHSQLFLLIVPFTNALSINALFWGIMYLLN
jgi:hypothetical protein